MGSETFIIVDLRCSDSSAPSRAAASICSEKNRRRVLTFITAVSTTSPASRDIPSLSAVTLPSALTNSIQTLVAADIVPDFSLSKKSPAVMWATRALDPDAGHGRIILWGCFRENSLTDVAARRSEFPSRRTGLTADPSTAEKRDCSAFSASFRGSSG